MAKQWSAVEICVNAHSRSLKMAPFNKSHMTYCQSAIVSTSLSSYALGNYASASGPRVLGGLLKNVYPLQPDKGP